MKSITRKYCFIVLSAVVFFTVSAFAAEAPLLPAEGTFNLYAMVEGDEDNGTVNILEVAPDGTPVILVSKADLYALVELDPAELVLSFHQGGIVTTESRSIVFTLTSGDGPYGEDGNWIVERLPDGTLSIIADQDDITAETGEAYAEPEGLVLGNDGMLYCIDEISRSLIQINPGTGTTSQFVTKAAFQGLISASDFDPESGLSADENYIYIASDGTPDTIYRVDYSGNPEVFASGPGTDPTALVQRLMAIWLEGPPTSGYFTLDLTQDGGDTLSTTGNIGWNADASVVQTAINTATGSTMVDVTGGGIESDPWVLTFVGGASWDIIGWSDVLTDGYIIVEYWRSSRHENVVDHVEAIGTASSTGLIEINMEDSDRVAPGYMGSASWSVGDDASDVQAALINAEPDDDIGPGDVTVTGAGTLADPWVITFVGNLSKHHIRIDIDSFSGGEVDTPLLVGTMVNATAFDDADGYLTRSESGSLMLNDDSQAHFLYEITTSGDTSIFLSEWDLMLATGGELDLEGGIVYDSGGNLYVGNDHADEYYNSSGAILKIAPDKTIESWLPAETIASLTGDQARDIKFSGMAFERSSLQIDKCKVKAGKNGKGDSIKLKGLLGATEADFNAAMSGNVIVTIEADDIPDTDITTFTFPIEEDTLKKGKYKSSKVKPLDKSDPVTSFKISTKKGKFAFSAKNVDLAGLSCPMIITIQIGEYAAQIQLDENIVNGPKKPCPPELMMGI